MSNWSAVLSPVLGGRGYRYAVREGASPISFEKTLRLLEDSDDFCRFLTETIAHSEYVALRWETPPITKWTLGREFEFVLANDPFLEMDPEPEVFGPYFNGLPEAVQVLAVPNRAGTAKLVVPRQRAERECYVHLSRFLRSAPTDQVRELWRSVAVATRQELSDRRIWVSTAGGGVSWLHVRIEPEPKYYSYRPYANAA